MSKLCSYDIILSLLGLLGVPVLQKHSHIRLGDLIERSPEEVRALNVAAQPFVSVKVLRKFPLDKFQACKVIPNLQLPLRIQAAPGVLVRIPSWCHSLVYSVNDTRD